MRFLFSLQVTSHSKQWPQIIAVLSASLSAISVGMHYSWPSPALPIIMSNEFPINITSEESSYIASIAPLGDLLGAPLAGLLSGSIGRKYGLLFIALPMFASWMFIAFANSFWMFCIGRFLAGVAEGIVFIILFMYNGEVAEPSIRGVLSSVFVVNLTTGMLLISAYAPFLSIRDSSLISAIVPVLFVICFMWMPESPYYLIMKGQDKQAKQALHFLRRCDIEEDFAVLKNDINRQMSEKGTLKDLFCINSNRKAVLIAFAARALQQFSGMSFRVVFIQTIFDQAGANVSPVLLSCIYLLVQLILSLWVSVLMDKYGRTSLLTVSCIGSAVLSTILGLYFYVQEMTDIDISSITWISIVAILGVLMFNVIGIVTVPNTWMAELFSTSVKGKALCIVCIANSLFISITTKLYYFTTEKFGLYFSFFMCTIVLLFGIAYSFFVPETKGKSLEEIQQILKGSKSHVGISKCNKQKIVAVQ